jgi:deoxyribonuclease-4
MKYIGAHVSIAGGIENAPVNAGKIGAKAFAMFTKNQRQWKTKPLEDSHIKAFKDNLKISGIQKEHVLCHDGYLINLGNPDKDKRQKSLDLFIVEAQRVEKLGLTLLNFHPGSHLRLISENRCMELIADGIKKAIASTDNVVFVLETTAGQGSNIGHTFEQCRADGDLYRHMSYFCCRI